MSQQFRPFHQNQRLAGGKGLGLNSLAKRVEAMQGKYGVQGSLFGLRFHFIQILLQPLSSAMSDGDTGPHDKEPVDRAKVADLPTCS
jgi:hypothetical protein